MRDLLVKDNPSKRGDITGRYRYLKSEFIQKNCVAVAPTEGQGWVRTWNKSNSFLFCHPSFLRKSFVFFLLLLFVVGCKSKRPADKEATTEKIQTYTCSMHPQIIRNEPGTCPICGMDLVPFDRNNISASLTLDKSQQALGNITSMVVDTSSISNSIRLNGRLVVNPEQTTYISSRIDGRIENLYVRETGIVVQKGQLLYKIYSEQLNSLQQEYLLAYQQAISFPDDERFRQIELAAKQKLMLYGQDEEQVQQLINKKSTSPYILYNAPASGTVAELNVTEGQYVNEGSPLMRLENYSTLWVEADLYPNEIPVIRQGQKVNVVIPGWENNVQGMTINFITPSLQPGAQFSQIRGTINNINYQWRPGLQANIIVPAKIKSKALTIPTNSVIRNGNSAITWIETEDGKYEPRKVKTGIENFDKVEITEGLHAGDKVVITGAYLLYSEYVLKKGMLPGK